MFFCSWNSGEGAKLYVNGQLVNTGTVRSGTISNQSGAVYRIGYESNGSNIRWFPGRIDEVKVYTSARTAAQIQSDFNSKGSLLAAANSFGATDPSHSLSNGLVGYWKMDEASWTNNCSTASVLDSSGNAINGTACPNSTGPTGGAAGKFGNAGSFDGTNDYISLGTSTTLDVSTSFTASAWVNTTATTRQVIFSSGTTDAQYWSMDLSSGTARLTLVNDAGTSYTGSTNLVANTWNHVVIVKDGDLGTNVKLFLNGVLDGTGAAGTLSSVGTKSIGSRLEAPTSNVFNGKIDDVRIYNRALSDQEVRTLYDWAPGPVVYWNMDERTGTTANDISGNGNTGTLTNGPTWGAGKVSSAMILDGTDDSLAAGDINSIDGLNAFTISTWIKANALVDYPAFFSKRSSSTSKIQLGLSGTGEGSNNDLEITVANGNANSYMYSTSNILTTGIWNYITAVYDGSQSTDATKLKLFINGVQVALTSGGGTIPTTAPSNSGAVNVGVEQGVGIYFNGSIDDMKVYSYARSQKQIVQDMQGSHPAVGGANGGAVGYWKFDEGQGTTGNNFGNGGSTLNGTLTNMAAPATATSGWTAAGKFQKALVFDKSNDYVSVADNNAIDLGQGADKSFSLSVWYYKSNSDTATQFLISKRDSESSGNTDYSLFIETNQLGWGTGSSIDSCAWLKVTEPSINTWHHVVGTLIQTGTSTGTKSLYIDGKLITTCSYTQKPASNTGNLIFGRGFSSNYYGGQIDEVKIYNYALFADDITRDYNQGASEKMGSLSTASDGITNSNGADRAYCVPGDTTSCAAPVGEWKFDERTGTSVTDSSGNNYNGTWGGTGTHWSPGKISQAGSFNGTDDRVVTSTSTTALDTTSAVTLEAWVNPSTLVQATSPEIIAKSTNAEYYRMRFLNGGTVRFNTFGTTAPATASVTSLTANAWNHVSMVYDGATSKIYLNGKLDISTANTGTMTTGSNPPLYIGGFASSEFFSGKIDNVQIYNYARTPAQIAWDYNRGGPVTWYKMDECQGASVNDASGNSNTGTITIGASGTQTTVGNCTSANSAHAWSNGATGKFSNSLKFDGTDDSVSIPYSGIFNPTNYLTVSAWIKAPSYNGSGAIIVLPGSYWFGQYTDKVAFNTKGGSVLTGTTPLGNNNWYHIVGVYNSTAGSMSVYLNGNLENTTTAGATVATTLSSVSSALTLGTGNLVNSTAITNWNGQIDDVRIYNYPLTQNQIQTLYNENSALRFGPATGSP